MGGIITTDRIFILCEQRKQVDEKEGIVVIGHCKLLQLSSCLAGEFWSDYSGHTLLDADVLSSLQKFHRMTYCIQWVCEHLLVDMCALFASAACSLQGGLCRGLAMGTFLGIQTFSEG